jgi:hypothetical protein
MMESFTNAGINKVSNALYSLWKHKKLERVPYADPDSHSKFLYGLPGALSTPATSAVKPTTVRKRRRSSKVNGREPTINIYLGDRRMELTKSQALELRAQVDVFFPPK